MDLVSLGHGSFDSSRKAHRRPKFAFAQTEPNTTTPSSEGAEMANTTPQTGYAPVNGLNIYYEIHGAGRPLVLLHGALGTIDMFGELPRAHGRHRSPVSLRADGRRHRRPPPAPQHRQCRRLRL